MRTLVYPFALVLLLVVGCQKKPSTETQTAPAPTVPLVAADQRSAHFNAVNQHLELGGVLYGYVDVDGDVEKLGQALTEFAAQMGSVQPAAAMFKQDYAPILASLGLSDVKALGFSSVAAAPGFRNRVFFYTPQGRRGLLAAAGGPPHAFSNVHYAPTDADLFSETELNVPAAYAALKAVVAKIGGDTAVNALEADLKKAKPPQPTVYDVIQQLNGRFTALLRINTNEQLKLPLPKPIDLPGISFFIRADGLGKALGPMLTALPPIRKTQEGSRILYEWPQPVSGGKLQPVFTIEQDALIIGSDRAFLLECLNRTAGLDQQPEFKAALASVGTEGNGLTYLSPHLYEKLAGALNKVAEQNNDYKIVVDAWVKKLPQTDHPLISVRSNLADGILIQAQWDRSLKQEAMMSTAGNPVAIGLLAAMAIPAFQKVRANSRKN